MTVKQLRGVFVGRCVKMYIIIALPVSVTVVVASVRCLYALDLRRCSYTACHSAVTIRLDHFSIQT